MSFFNSQPEEATYIIDNPDSRSVSPVLELSQRKCYAWKNDEDNFLHYSKVFNVTSLSDIIEIVPLLSKYYPLYYAVARQEQEISSADAMLKGSNFAYTYEKELHLSHGYDLEMITVDIYRLVSQQ